MNYNTPAMGTYGSTWQAYNYSGNGNVEPLLGSLGGRAAIVCGGDYRVFDELAVARYLLRKEDPVLFAVNDVGMSIDGLDHWVSLHGDQFPAWKAVRWQRKFKNPEVTKYHSISDQFADYSWAGLNPLMALSGYFAMQVAYLMGAGRIVLCGCPGTATRRFFDEVARDDFGYGGGTSQSDRNIQEQIKMEMLRVPEFKDKVRSMGGWTKSFFGRV